MHKPSIIYGACAAGLIMYGGFMTSEAQTRKSPIASAGDNLRLELSWRAPVDLDLFVTNPSGETIYYGNKKSRNGDKLVQESNCKNLTTKPVIMRETVLIPSAISGRYRVSVDFIFQCETNSEEADAGLTLFNAQTESALAQQTITVKRQILNTVAWEFEVSKK
jgi:uncharacterized protein YfaP (DUF2135 family)